MPRGGRGPTSAPRSDASVGGGCDDADWFQTLPSHKRKRLSRTESTYHTNASTNGWNSAMGGSQAPRKFSNTGPSTLASQLGRSNIHRLLNRNCVYDPSLGPGSSVVPQSRERRAATSSYAGGGSSHQHQKVAPSNVCKLGRYSRRDFLLGDIIALPFHTPNLNPNIDPSDRRLVQTVEGPAYSKRRMFVVLFMHRRDLFCLPLYTFGGSGLKGKNEDIKREYVCVKNVGDSHFDNQGPNPEVEAYCSRRLDRNTTCHITGGVKVSSNEDITIAGRMTFEGYYDLLGLWKNETSYAAEEPWRDS